jgi:hypothetical protein
MKTKINFRAKHDAQRKGPSILKAPSKGAIEGLPVLRYGTAEQNNFSKFREELSIYCLREFGDLGRTIQTGEEHEYPAIEVPADETLGAEADPHGFTKAMYLEEVKSRKKKVEAFEKNKLPMYATIYGQLSKESKEKIKEDDAWDEIDTLKDPVRLWVLIGATHQSGGSGTERLDKLQARNFYNSLVQGKHETCLEFKERTTSALEMMLAAGEAEKSEEDQASDYIHRLDNDRYAQLKTDLANDLRKGLTTYPATLLEAYRLAAEYKIVVTQSSRSTSTVFAITSAESSRRSAPEGKNLVDKGGKKPKPKAATTKAAGSSDGKAAHYKKPTAQNGSAAKQSKSKQQSKVAKVPKDGKGCWLCGGDHFASVCPNAEEFIEDFEEEEPIKSRQQNRKSVSVAFAEEESDDDGAIVLAGARGGAGLLDTDILLDNQASISIFKNEDLVTNLREAQSGCVIKGISGNIRVSQIGDVKYCGEVWYNSKVLANVWSFDQAKRMYEVSYDQDSDKFDVAVSEDKTLEFRNREGLYVHDGRHMRTQAIVQVQTVKQNELLYTPRQVADAKKARELMRRLGYISSKDEALMLNTGSILNCPVSSSDVYRAARIQGMDVASLKGKTRWSPSAIVKIEEVPRPVFTRQVLHVDIMFIEGDPYLISVSTPLLLTMVNHLGGRKSTPVIREALNKQLAMYRAESFEVGNVLTDGEGGVHALTPELSMSQSSITRSSKSRVEYAHMCISYRSCCASRF